MLAFLKEYFMKLKKLVIKNFKSIEDISLNFDEHYTAISGKNNSGKSNILKPLKLLFVPEPRYRFSNEDEINYTKDIPTWKKSLNEEIKIEAHLCSHQTTDASFLKFIKLLSELSASEILSQNEINFILSVEYKSDDGQPTYTANFGNIELDKYTSKTIFEHIKKSNIFQFYNSTELYNPFDDRIHLADLIGELSKADRNKIDHDRLKLSRTISEVAKNHQKDAGELLGRLEEKYSIGLAAAELSLDYVPINILLGDKKVDIDINNWGSGTKNRTQILLSLFKAKKLSEAQDEEIRISPILIIEEPESFLHPSAQAEFGRILQDISNEFNIQLIVSTHNPYFLSQSDPKSNVLLTREKGKESAKTKVTEVDSGNWMNPFAENLGISNKEFEPWRNLMFSNSDRLLLVEGEIDKNYFELLKNELHGKNRLDFSGEIYPYGGVGNINNGVLLRFIKNRYNKIYITYDLDSEGNLSKLLESLGFERNAHFYPIGIDSAGKRDIEGLLPDSIKQNVYRSNTELVDQWTKGNSEEKKSAKARLKQALYTEFSKSAKPGDFYYSEFYKLSSVINNAFR